MGGVPGPLQGSQELLVPESVVAKINGGVHLRSVPTGVGLLYIGKTFMFLKEQKTG